MATTTCYICNSEALSERGDCPICKHPLLPPERGCTVQIIRILQRSLTGLLFAGFIISLIAHVFLSH